MLLRRHASVTPLAHVRFFFFLSSFLAFRHGLFAWLDFQTACSETDELRKWRELKGEGLQCCHAPTQCEDVVRINKLGDRRRTCKNHRSLYYNEIHFLSYVELVIAYYIKQHVKSTPLCTLPDGSVVVGCSFFCSPRRPCRVVSCTATKTRDLAIFARHSLSWIIEEADGCA